MPFHKEPLYFGDDLTRRYGRMSEPEYLALFADARPDQRVGEASAWHLYSASAPREIEAASPTASIIVMLRNPVDVMYAQHSQLLFGHQEDIEDFEEALGLESARRAGAAPPRRPSGPENLFYRRMVRFAEQLERYFEVFGRDRVHVTIHEDLRADLRGTYRGTLRFLGVDAGFAPTFRRRTSTSGSATAGCSRSSGTRRLRRMIPRLRRYRLVHSLRARLLALNSTEVSRDAIDPALRSRLQVEMAPNWPAPATSSDATCPAGSKMPGRRANVAGACPPDDAMTKLTRGAEFEVDETDLQGRVARGLTWTMTDIGVASRSTWSRSSSSPDCFRIRTSDWSRWRPCSSPSRSLRRPGTGDALIQRRTVSRATSTRRSGWRSPRSTADRRRRRGRSADRRARQ